MSWSLLLDVGGRHDLSWEVEPFSEVVEPFGSQGVVVVLPGELSLEVASRGQGLGGFDDLDTLLESRSETMEEILRIGSWCRCRGALGG